MEPYELNGHKVKFMHLRQEDEEENLSAKGGLTIAYAESEHGVEWAYAICNSHDHYCKKIGRAISLGRLKKGAGFQVPTKKAFHEELYEVVRNLEAA